MTANQNSRHRGDKRIDLAQDIRFVRHITAERNTLNCGGYALGGLQVDIGNNDCFRSGLVKGVAECAPDAASSSRDDDCFAGQLHSGHNSSK